MRTCYVVFVGCVLVISAFVGCGSDPVAGVSMPDQLTLYSINGLVTARGKVPESEDEFHGFPVLGKVELIDAVKRQEIMAALKEGVTRSDGNMAKCFWPRHAIRAVEKGHMVDYVICFECFQMEVHEGSTMNLKPVTREPQSLFNKYLNEADVPLTPDTNSINE